jgi:hypothetical protein
MGRASAGLLALCAALFLLRVIGQALVAFAGVRWLPPMPRWYSGLIPYPVLLPIQVGILTLQAAVLRDVWRGAGRFALPRPRLGRFLHGFALVYAAAMALRWVLSGLLVPQSGFLGPAIPVVAHEALAAWLFVYARWLRRDTERP